MPFIQKYALKTAASGHSAGTVVYGLVKPDYGLANDDTRNTGVPHISVTLDPTGDYPSFTVPESYLLFVATPPMAPSTRTVGKPALLAAPYGDELPKYVAAFTLTRAYKFGTYPKGSTVYEATPRTAEERRVKAKVEATGDTLLVTSDPSGNMALGRPPISAHLADLDAIPMTPPPAKVSDTTEAADGSWKLDKAGDFEMRNATVATPSSPWTTPDGKAPALREFKGQPLMQLGIGAAIALHLAAAERPAENAWLKHIGGLRYDIRALTAQTVAIRIYHDVTGDSAEITLAIS